MKIKHFLYVLISVPFFSQTRLLPEPPTVYVTNNGQIDLIVNDVLIPANPLEKDSYPVQIIRNLLVITARSNSSKYAVVKLREADAGTTIQIGSHGDVVAVLRSDKIPILIPFGTKQRYPKKL